jgi:hypothetical protein
VSRWIFPFSEASANGPPENGGSNKPGSFNDIVLEYAGKSGKALWKDPAGEDSDYTRFPNETSPAKDAAMPMSSAGSAITKLLRSVREMVKAILPKQ